MASLVDGVVAGDKRILARAISKIEREDEDGPELFGELYGRTGGALTVGFTGPPGVGKSSIIAKLIGLYRGEGKSVAVVSVDPSSPFSKGAILGDRIRLSDHFLDEGVFIRSMLEIGHELDPDAPTPEIVMTRGDNGEGVESLKTAVEAHRDRLVETGELGRRRRASLKDFVISWATGRLQKEMEERLKREDAGIMERVYERTLDPIAASEKVLHHAS